MEPAIPSFAKVRIEPSHGRTPSVGDVVAVDTGAERFLHRVLALEDDGGRALVGGDEGSINGWIERSSIYGICSRVDGRPVAPPPVRSPAPQT